ncbi:TPA: phospholipid carrier-dependent glycosyltransferase [Thermoplasmata archaeon]|nr:phospholipid carrier-dependent glycosyltransferase [Thermoplasmata archaeon]
MTGGLVFIPSLAEMIGSAYHRRVVAALLFVILAAVLLRMVNIGWSYSDNGIDEGVMVERVLMLDRGYSLYGDLPCDQAPLAFLVGSLLGGDVVSLRALVAIVSLFALGCCMYVSNRLGGAIAMLATGALLAVDFALVRESRLFSLDAMSAAFLAFSMAAFVLHLERKHMALLALAGLLAGVACAFKLIGGLALLGILLFLLTETMRKGMTPKAAMTGAVVASVSAAVPVIVLMLFLGPSEMIEGMVFDQGHREFDALLKVSLLVYFGVNVAFALPLICSTRVWRSGPRERFLLLLVLAIIAFMLIQPLVFLHHMVFLSPALSVLAGLVVSRSIGSKKHPLESVSSASEPKWACVRRAVIPALIVSLVVSGGLSSYGLVAQDEPAQIAWGRQVAQLTSADEYVICGDPLIAAYADRMMPPEVVNVAERQYPELTLERLCGAVTEYNVSLVLICYHLNDFEDLPGFLESEGFVEIAPDMGMPDGKAVLDLFQEGIDPVSLYVRL